MTTVQYCTPEWFQQVAKLYQDRPDLQDDLAKFSYKVSYKIKADPAWGIEQDIIFAFYVDKGHITSLGFISPEQAAAESEFILTATPQEWKKLLRGESKFVTDFVLGKVLLEKGSKVTVLGVAPYSTPLIKTLTLVDLQFPDEMTPEELEQYKAYHKEFRARLGI
jgi:putative sterol carrier protein